MKKTFFVLFLASCAAAPAETGRGPGDTAALAGGARPPQMNEGFIGRDVPHFDPGSEVFAMDGKLWNINNNRLLRARFEKYLNAPPADALEDRQYHETLAAIMGLLEPGQTNKQKFDRALALLGTAAQYRDDAKLSRTLADAIHSAQRNLKEIEKLRRDNQRLEEEKKKAEWNLKMAASQSMPRPGSSAPERDKAMQEQAAAEQELKLGQARRKFSEVSGTIENNKARMALTEMTTKGHLQALIMQFFATRRFQHTIIANRFYRALFTDGDTSLDAYKRSVEQLPANRDAGFATARVEIDPRVSGETKGGTYIHGGGGGSDGDVSRGGEGGGTFVPMGQSFEARGMKIGFDNLSVESMVGGAAAAARAVSKLVSSLSQIDALANEAMRDVDEGIEVFKFLVEQRELKSATERLAETFLLGEFMPSVRLLDRESKRKALEFFQKSNELLSALEVNDLGLAERLVNQLQEIAVDFDATKALAKIETAKAVSGMQIARAKSSAISGDKEKMEADLVAAMGTWQRNPELAKASEMIFSQADEQNRALLDFDQLLGQKNYRQIFDDQARFIAATVNDKKRAGQLKDVLERMAAIEGAVLRANEIWRRGDASGAWESVERAAEQYPDDTKLNAMRADLAVKSSGFVSALRTAREHEEKGQIGSALAWYLQAQQIYPPSDYAREGVERLIPAVFPDDPAFRK